MEYTVYLENDGRHIEILGNGKFRSVKGDKKNVEIMTGTNFNVAHAMHMGAKVSTQAKFEDVYGKALKRLNK